MSFFLTSDVKVLSDGSDGGSKSSRVLKVGIALVGGSCLVLLGIMALSASGPSTDESTSLFNRMPTSLRSGMQAKPPQMLTMSNVRNLPGPSPWKELALAAIADANRPVRDISMNANLKGVLANMGSSNKALVANAAADVVAKAEGAEMTAEDLKAGIVAPLGFWDPLGVSANIGEGKLLFYREVELKHGRVAMLAALGFVVGEQFHPLFGGNIDVPSYIAFQETPLEKFWYIVSIAIAIPEVIFSIPTFQKPTDESGLYKDQDTWNMKTGTGRIPGDLGWDPLGLKPKDPAALLEMQNKEILNGRLAMISIAGMVAQELVTGKKLF
jgi:hypothetical protein